MAAARIKAELKRKIEGKREGALRAISEKLGIATPRPVTGRFADPDMKAIRYEESLSEWLENVRAALESPENPADTVNTVSAVDLESLTVTQLRALADANGIDLGGATRKAEIIGIITGG